MNNPIDKVTDPAERKQAETALQEREQLLRQLAETIQEVFWMISPDWKQVFYVSPAYEMLWGRTCESLYVNPLSWLEAVLPEDRQALQALVQQQIRDDSVSAEALLYRIRRPDGAIRWIRARSFAIRDEEQRVYRIAGFAMDITKEKQVEQALRASETRLRTVIESLPFDFFVLDEQGRYSMQNSVCRAHWGNAVGKRPEEIIDDPEIRALWQENNRRAYAGDVVKGQVRYHLEGTDRIYYNIISPILENDRIRGILGFNIDITEQKHVEDSLQQRVAMEDLIARISSRLIRLTAAETDLGIQETLSELGTFIGVDRSYVFLFSDDLLSFTNTHEWCAAGITPQIHHLQNLPAERFGWFCRHICNREVIHIPRVADLPDEAAAEKAEFQRQEILSMLCIPIVSRNLLIGFMGYDAVRGEKTWSEDLIALLRIVGDNIAHALARKQHDQELHEYQQRLQSLASELSLTEERQRRQLANDLHENIGQLLALMKIKLGMLKEKAAQPDERAQIQEVRDLLENTLAYARNLTLDLSPPVLYELGLKEALEWLIEQFRRQHQLKITYRVHQQKDTGEIRMEDDLRGLLYRCVRELLVNIAKHARAQRADIRMELSNGQIAIQVQDDGIGMSPNRIGQKKTLQEGFGLFNIRERLAHFGGTVTIASAPKQGTTVILRCPLQNAGP